jgi:hypothetical protein
LQSLCFAKCEMAWSSAMCSPRTLPRTEPGSSIASANQSPIADQSGQCQ